MKTPRLRSHFIALLLLALVALTSTPAEAALTPEQLVDLQPKVIAQLESPQKKVRQFAIRALGEMADKKGLKEFKKYTSSEDPIIKHAALIALVRRGDKGAIKTIGKILQGADAAKLPPLLSELLLPLASKTRRATLKTLLKKPSNDHLSAIAKFIVATGDADDFKLLLPSAKLKTAEARQVVIDVLAKNPRAESLSFAKALMKSKDSSARQQALKLAKKLETADSKEIIVKGLKDKDEGVKNTAIDLLIEMKHPAIVPTLEARLKADPKDMKTLSLLTSFEPRGLDDLLFPIVEPVVPAISQEDYNNTMALLARGGSGKFKALIKTKLKGMDEAGRIAATHAIGFTEDRSFSPDLVRLLSDGSVRVRREAASSLGLLGDPANLPAIKKSLAKDRDTELKLRLIHAIALVGDPTGARALQSYLGGRDKDLKLAALETVVTLKARGVLRGVELIAKDRSAELRWRGAVALFLIDPDKYGDKLNKALADAPEDTFFETLGSLDEETQNELITKVLQGQRASLAIELIGTAGRRMNPKDIQRLRMAYDKSPKPAVRKAAIKALSQRTFPVDLLRLKKLSEHSDRRLQIQALNTLLQHDPGKTTAVFTHASESADPLVQMMGIYALSRR